MIIQGPSTQFPEFPCRWYDIEQCLHVGQVVHANCSGSIDAAYDSRILPLRSDGAVGGTLQHWGQPAGVLLSLRSSLIAIIKPLLLTGLTIDELITLPKSGAGNCATQE